MAMPMQMPFGMPMGYGGQPMMPFQAGPAGMPAMYAMPYYVMPQGIQGMPQQPQFMPAAPAPVAQPPPLSPEARENLKAQVKEQIEYYFGMENLLKDVFLRKHMTDQGWLPIALLAGFRRIQQMTLDPNILMDAVSESTLLEVSPQGTHLRLQDDWPRWILAPQGASGAVSAAAPEQRPA
jgi:la-related protein 1